MRRWVVAGVAALALLGGGFVAGRVTAPDAAGRAGAASNGGGDSELRGQVDALLAQALDLHSQGRVGEAATLYRQMLDLEPTNQYAHYNLGVIAHRAGDAEQAITEYLAAIDTDPGFSSALYNLGLVYADRGDTSAAVEYLRRAVEADPESAAAHFNLGTQLTKQGNTVEGQAELEKAYALDPALQP